MANIKFVVNRAGVQELLGTPEVAKELNRRAENVRAAAESLAPEKDGDLAKSHSVISDTTSNGRARARVVAEVPYAAIVGARTGYLAKALGTGGRA